MEFLDWNRLHLWSRTNLTARLQADLDNKQAQDTSPQCYGLLFETKVFCITELASRSQMEFWKAPCNLEQKDDSSVSQSPLWKAGRLVGALDAKIAREIEDTPALPPQLTFEEKCLHQIHWIIYSNAWKQSLDNDTSIKCSLNRGWLFI